MRRLGWTLVLVSLALVGCRTVAKASTRPALDPALPLAQQAKRLRLRYPLRYVFLRALKEERRLELWAADRHGRMTLVREYPIAAASGGPGPKRREGDFQVPEGVYRIDRFNPKSRFHLSLGLDYPNPSDRLRGDPAYPGTNIFIHGNAVSIGCMAMTDRLIDEIYPTCEKALNRKTIAVHVFPCRMTKTNLSRLASVNPEHAAFWRELQPIYAAFERTRRVPRVGITRTGAYRIEP